MLYPCSKKKGVPSVYPQTAMIEAVNGKFRIVGFPGLVGGKAMDRLYAPVAKREVVEFKGEVQVKTQKTLTFKYLEELAEISKDAERVTKAYWKGFVVMGRGGLEVVKRFGDTRR